MWFIDPPPFFTCVVQVTGGIGISSRSTLCIEGWWWREIGSAVTVYSFWILVMTFFLVVVVPPMEHNFRNKARVASLGWSLCHGCDDWERVSSLLDLKSCTGRLKSTFTSDFESKMLIVLYCLSNSSGACCSACVQKWSSIIIRQICVCKPVSSTEMSNIRSAVLET